MPLKVGVECPHTVSSVDPVAFARRAEEMGFDSLWTGENLLGPSERLDPFALLGAWAAATRRITLGSNVTRLPLRHPLLLAQAVATVDALSGGRFILGVGVGGDEPREFAALGVPLSERGRRTDATLGALKALWGEGSAEYHSRFFSFEGVELRPRPLQRPHPPIWVAGRSEAAVRRAARVGDGYIPYLFTPERFARSLALLEEAAAARGRSLDGFTKAVHVFVAAGGDRSLVARVEQKMGAEYGLSPEQTARLCVLGDAQGCLEGLAQFVKAGVQHLVLSLAAPPGNELTQLDLLAGQVLPRLRTL